MQNLSKKFNRLKVVPGDWAYRINAGLTEYMHWSVYAGGAVLLLLLIHGYLNTDALKKNTGPFIKTGQVFVSFTMQSILVSLAAKSIVSSLAKDKEF